MIHGHGKQRDNKFVGFKLCRVAEQFTFSKRLLFFENNNFFQMSNHINNFSFFRKYQNRAALVPQYEFGHIWNYIRKFIFDGFGASHKWLSQC